MHSRRHEVGIRSGLHYIFPTRNKYEKNQSEKGHPVGTTQHHSDYITPWEPPLIHQMKYTVIMSYDSTGTPRGSSVY